MATGIAGFVAGVLDEVLGLDILSPLMSLVTLLPSLAVGVRRIHDHDKNGLWILCPIYNFILFILEGEKGDNKYGHAPRK